MTIESVFKLLDYGWPLVVMLVVGWWGIKGVNAIASWLATEVVLPTRDHIIGLIHDIQEHLSRTDENVEAQTSVLKEIHQRMDSGDVCRFERQELNQR